MQQPESQSTQATLLGPVEIFQILATRKILFFSLALLVWTAFAYRNFSQPKKFETQAFLDVGTYSLWEPKAMTRKGHYFQAPEKLAFEIKTTFVATGGAQLVESVIESKELDSVVRVTVRGDTENESTEAMKTLLAPFQTKHQDIFRAVSTQLRENSARYDKEAATTRSAIDTLEVQVKRYLASNPAAAAAAYAEKWRMGERLAEIERERGLNESLGQDPWLRETKIKYQPTRYVGLPLTRLAFNLGWGLLVSVLLAAIGTILFNNFSQIQITAPVRTS